MKQSASQNLEKELCYSQRGNLLIDPDAINLYAIVPCPIKVRFKAECEAYIEQYNASHITPIYCPTIYDNGQKEIEDMMQHAESEEQLPDVWVTTHYHTLFSTEFRERFIDTGIYEGIIPPEQLDNLSPSQLEAAQKYNLGFLAFGVWGLVCDTQMIQSDDYPTSWLALTDPKYKQQLSAPGYKGNMGGTGLLLHLQSIGGEKAIRAFANSVKKIRHFSKLIKGINSQDDDRSAIYMMPNAAVRQIPSNKKAVQLQFSEGGIVAPVMIFVKRSKRAQCQEIIDFFWSEQMRNTLKYGDIFMPDEMDWQQNNIFPDWSMLVNCHFPDLHEEITAIFNSALAPSVYCE